MLSIILGNKDRAIINHTETERVLGVHFNCYNVANSRPDLNNETQMGGRLTSFAKIEKANANSTTSAGG